MSHGVISNFSEVVEWTIPSYFSLDVIAVESPLFLLAGLKWRIILIPVGFARVVIKNDTPDSDVKTVTCSLGVKKDSCIVEERKPFICWYRGGYNCSYPNYGRIGDLLQKHRTELAPSNAITIACRLDRGVPIPMELDPQRTMIMELADLSSDFKDLLNSDRRWDVRVIVQGKEFRAHRVVLSARSPVFRAMYEHDTAEAKSGILTIKDCDSESFGDFLNFLYTGRLELISFDTACHLYSTANKYDVQRLKSFCGEYLEKNLTVETVCDVFLMADLFGDNQLQSSAQNFFNKNYLMILLTPEWKAMLKNNLHLADNVLSEMASDGLKKIENNARQE